MSKFLPLVIALGLASQAPAALAQVHHGASSGQQHAMPSGGAHGGVGRSEFHGRSFDNLSPDDRLHWSHGEWRHAWHGGVYGWWWFLDDDWFYYPEPLYPYPTYIAPPPGPPQPTMWYRCDDPPGFYPYVAACHSGWKPVPATPADLGAPPPPPG